MDNRITNLLLKKISCIATQEEEAYVNKLIEEDPAVKKEYEDYLALYNRPDFQEGITRESMDEVYDNIMRRPKRRKRALIAAATTFIVVLAAGGYLLLKTPKPAALPSSEGVVITLANGRYVQLSDSGTVKAGAATINAKAGSASYQVEGASTALNTLAVPKGKRYTFRLADGTSVNLNAATTLRFPFSFGPGARQVYVDGEAFFSVSPDPDHPFVVHTPTGTIKVLGTRFNVNSYKHLVVSLQSGAISVGNKTRSIALQPGQEALIDSPTGDLTTRPFDADERFSWLTGKIILDNLPLSEIATIVERHFGIKVFLDRPGIENESFMGLIDCNKPITVFITNINMVFHDHLVWTLDSAGNVHVR